MMNIKPFSEEWAINYAPQFFPDEVRKRLQKQYNLKEVENDGCKESDQQPGGGEKIIRACRFKRKAGIAKKQE
jgi:hypothetical protein